MRTMARAAVDDQGRLYLPKEVREEYGDEYRIVPFRGELRLIPVPDDPVQDLRERTKEIRESDETVDELKQEAREHLEQVAGE